MNAPQNSDIYVTSFLFTLLENSGFRGKMKGENLSVDMVIDDVGNIGIGETSPWARLDVKRTGEGILHRYPGRGSFVNRSLPVRT